MSYLKKKITVMFAMMLVLLSVFDVMPGSTMEVEAASKSYQIAFNYNMGNTSYSASGTATTTYEMKIEAGQTVSCIGNHAYYQQRQVLNGYTYTTTLSLLSAKSGVSYKSSVPSVATVNSKTGKLVTKKAGTTVITVKLGSLSQKLTLTVVKKGALGSTKSGVKAIKTKAVKLLNTYNGKMTLKNCYSVNNQYYELVDKVNVNKVGLATGTAYVGFKNDSIRGATNELVIPELQDAYAIYSDMWDYAAKTNPIGTSASKYFKISTVTGKAKTNQVTVTLKSKVTEKQSFSIKFCEREDTYLTKSTACAWNVWVKDTKTGNTYKARATAKIGSNKIDIRIYNMKLIKGRKYMLTQYLTDSAAESKACWTKGKTFTAK